MNSENDLKQQMKALGIATGPGRIDEVDFDDTGGADWLIGERHINNIDAKNLEVGRVRLGMAESADKEEVQEELKEQLNFFKFSFHAWSTSYGEEQDPDEPLTWLSDGKNFLDDFHRAAWILAGCGVLQACRLEVQGFDL